MPTYNIAIFESLTSIGSKKVGSVICLEANPFATMTETDPLTDKVHDRQEKNTEFVWNKWPVTDHQVKRLWEYRSGWVLGNGIMLHIMMIVALSCFLILPFFARTGIIS